MSVRKGILFAAPGTTCREALVGYDQIAAAAALRFPGVEQRWTYTSAGIRRKLAEQGTPVKDPGEALTAMRDEGFTMVAVLSLHLSDGMEYGELAHTAATWSRQPETPLKLALGHALLTSKTDWRRALAAILAELPDTPAENDRIILVAHGSREQQARKTLMAAAQLCRAFDQRLILGMMIGTPGLDEVVGECRAAEVTKVWLLPCMVVAGFSAREEIAGLGEQSWATAMEQVGIAPIPVIKGLGEMTGVVNIWMDNIDRMFARLPETN
ncbi:MAG: sirohydrochlorin cobaltochelatase [bacterium]